MQTHVDPRTSVNPAVLTTDIDLTADLDAHAPLEVAARSPSLEAVARNTSTQPVRDTPARIVKPQRQPAEEPRPRLPIAPGRVLRDRYVLAQLVGTGGSCVVYRARDLEATSTNHRPTFVALKTPRADLADPSRAIARLRREYAHAQNLSHASIVQVLDLDCDGDVWFMTMEMLDGESLAAIVRRLAAPLPPHLTRRVLQCTAEALAYSHWLGVVHGDLNPANVFVEKHDRVKILDFGAACSPKQAASAAATPAYASPQVLSGAAPTVRDDVFSFACIAYECLVGKHPFQQRASNVAQAEGAQLELPAEITAEQAQALRSALAWDSDNRPDDVKALARALAPPTVRRRVNIVVEPEEELEAPMPQDDKRWWLLGAACVIAMVVAVIATRIG